MAVGGYRSNPSKNVELFVEHGYLGTTMDNSLLDLWQHDGENSNDAFYNSDLSTNRHGSFPQTSLNNSSDDPCRIPFGTLELPKTPLTDSGPNQSCQSYTPPLKGPGTTSKGRRYPPERWNQMRPLLQHLYIDQGISLPEAKRILEEEHNFIASCVFASTTLRKRG